MSHVGRPKSKNPRNINLNIRITKDEAKEIKECAEKLNITRTDAIIAGIRMIMNKSKN